MQATIILLIIFKVQSVYDFIDGYEDFMEIELEDDSPKNLIHALSGILIDDFETYESFDKYDLKIFYKENHVMINRGC